jgi:5-methylcytosine-specific restriction endonuclease McrA
MHQELHGAVFHVEHIIPRSAGGGDDLDNLAWACPGCNLSKTSRVILPDPLTGQEVGA